MNAVCVAVSISWVPMQCDSLLLQGPSAPNRASAPEFNCNLWSHWLHTHNPVSTQKSRSCWQPTVHGGLDGKLSTVWISWGPCSSKSRKACYRSDLQFEGIVGDFVMSASGSKAYLSLICLKPWCFSLAIVNDPDWLCTAKFMSPFNHARCSGLWGHCGKSSNPENRHLPNILSPADNPNNVPVSNPFWWGFFGLEPDESFASCMDSTRELTLCVLLSSNRVSITYSSRNLQQANQEKPSWLSEHNKTRCIRSSPFFPN